MDWRDRIGADPDVLVGKPVIKGTRIAVLLLPQVAEKTPKRGQFESGPIIQMVAKLGKWGGMGAIRSVGRQ